MKKYVYVITRGYWEDMEVCAVVEDLEKADEICEQLNDSYRENVEDDDDPFSIVKVPFNRTFKELEKKLVK
jgi:hypothetical protein